MNKDERCLGLSRDQMFNGIIITKILRELLLSNSLSHAY
jgi:hypothetical protein